MYQILTNIVSFFVDLSAPCSPLLEDKSPTVHEALARMCGPLSCVVSRRAKPNRMLATGCGTGVLSCIEIRCHHSAGQAVTLIGSVF